MDIICRRLGGECYGEREFTLLFDISVRLLKGGEVNPLLTSVLENLLRTNLLIATCISAGSKFFLRTLTSLKPSYVAKRLSGG